MCGRLVGVPNRVLVPKPYLVSGQKTLFCTAPFRLYAWYT
jgi:hypothetical protein